MNDDRVATELEAYLRQQIPVARLMGIQVAEASAGRVVLTAPLAVNHNHLGTAFGGSLAAVATLAGYAALWTALGDRSVHVVVRRSSLDYRRPVTGDITAVCEMPAGGPGDAFRAALTSRGKARLSLEVLIVEGGETCVAFAGEFVALRG